MLSVTSKQWWIYRIFLSVWVLHKWPATSFLVPRNDVVDKNPCRVSTVTLFAKSVTNGGSNITEEDPRLFQKRIREEQLNAILQSKSNDNSRSIQQRVAQQRNKKEIVQKRRQGEAASAAMDLPKESMVTTIGGGTNALFESIRNAVVPRWHPVTGVADVNPFFRVESPAMNSNGYSASIWRNARKRQPAMWRYALRTFDRMIQQQQQQQTQSNGPKLDIVNAHYEGALVAASKLGWSKRAIDILDMVEAKEESILKRLQQSSSSSAKSKSGTVQANKFSVHVSENMVLSVVRAAVREATKQKTREPLDRVLKHVILRITERHGITITSVHLNPIAAAYQSIGYTTDSNNILLGNLSDRMGGPEGENVIDTNFNVYDVQAKDKGSYSLLVQSAIQEQNWGQAARALKTMTEDGLYPSKRHLNIWDEVSGKRYSYRRRLQASTVEEAAKMTEQTYNY